MKPLLRGCLVAFVCLLGLCMLLARPSGQFIPQIASVTGNITSAGATCSKLVLDSSNSAITNCVSMQLPSTAAQASIVLAGTFSATIQFEVSADYGNSWIAAGVASSTTAGTSNFSFAGYNGVRARASSYTSGTVIVTITPSSGNGGVSNGITPGYPTSGGPNGQLFTSALYIDAGNYCNKAGFVSYSATQASPGCTGSYDSTHQIGHGMCEAITQAMAYAINQTSSNAPLIDARGFSGTQFFTAGCGTTMLYGGSTVPPGSTVDGKLQLGTVTILVDGPTGSSFTDGASPNPSTVGTPAIILPNQFTGIFGNGKDATLFIACSTTVTGCVHDWPSRSFAITSTSVSTNTMTITTSGSWTGSGGLAGGQTIYPTGGGITGEYGAIVGSSLDNNNALYIIKTVPSGTTATVGVPTGTSSCAANCGTLWLFTPMFGWGTQVANQGYIPQQGGAGLQSFGQRLEDLGIWGEITQVNQGKQWPFGFTAMQNVNGGENAGAQHIQCNYIGGICLDAHSGATDSGPWNDLRMTNLANVNAVRSTTAFAVASAMRGIMNSSAIEPYPVGTVTTSAGAIAPCAANCVQETGGTNFATLLANTQININGVFYTISTVNSNTVLTLTTSPGTQSGVTYQYGQPLACWLIDGQGPTVNQSPVFLMNHPEACQDGFRLAANYVVRGITIQGFLGGPNGAHADVNLIHAVAAGNSVLGTVVAGIDTQNGGATNTVLDDINGNTCLDLPLSLYTWDSQGSPSYSCKTGTFVTGIQTLNGLVHSFNATKSTSSDSASITATTAATSTTVFTFSGFSPNVTYKIHCSGTTVQSTAGAGIGIAFQTATNAASTELHATVATGAAAVAVQSSGLVSGTGANVIYAGSTGTITTQLPWTIDGTMAVGATLPSALNIGFYTISASDGVVVKQGSTCDIR